jgi:hypothetical protein
MICAFFLYFKYTKTAAIPPPIITTLKTTIITISPVLVPLPSSFLSSVISESVSSSLFPVESYVAERKVNF